jgi:hypothetical protein
MVFASEKRDLPVVQRFFEFFPSKGIPMSHWKTSYEMVPTLTELRTHPSQWGGVYRDAKPWGREADTALFTTKHGWRLTVGRTKDGLLYADVTDGWKYLGRTFNLYHGTPPIRGPWAHEPRLAGLSVRSFGGQQFWARSAE